MKIKEAFTAKGIPVFLDSPTNQQFFVLNQAQMDKLAEKFVYEYIEKVDEEHHCIRFCTSWSTKAEEVDELIALVETL